MRVDSKVVGVEKEGNSIAVKVESAGTVSQVVGTHVLVAIGRRPNTDDLGLDKADIATDARGYIQVDDQLRTSVARHLGDGRLQRPRRVHAHVVE